MVLIKNGFIITLDKERRVIRNGAVAFSGSEIVDVGKTDDLEKYYCSDDVIDASNKIIMPGLVNTHNHIYQTVMRGISDDRSRRNRTENKYAWNIDLLRHLDKEACYASGMLSAVEMIRSGITTNQDSHYINFHLDSIDGVAESAIESGMRIILGRGCWDLPGLAPKEFTEDIDTAIIESRRAISRLNGKGGGRVVIRIEASLLSQVTDDLIKATKHEADNNNVGWVMHIQGKLGTSSRDPRKNDPEINRYAGRSIEYVDDLGVLGADSLLVHCTYATNREIAILARTGTPVAHCPVANAWAGREVVAAVPTMIERGVTVGLGTDGALTNNSLDLFQTMKFCALIHKVNRGNAMAMTAEKVIEMSTIDAAKALNLENQIGSLEPGKKADIIILDTKSPGLSPRLLPVKNLVYSAAQGSPVETVIINGEMVMENNVILGFDEESAYREAEKQAFRLFEKSGRLDQDPGYLNPSPWKYD